eukprot:gene4377-27122_t
MVGTLDSFDFSRVNLEADLTLFATAFVLLFVVDFALAKVGWFPNDRNGRYLSLHVLTNGYVTAVHLDDVYDTYTSDVLDVYRKECDSRGVMVIFALHLYHIVFYQPLSTMDWIHHVVMCIIMLPLAWLLQPGPLLGHGAFFASGLPGGLDYVMLIMVKQGWMQSLTEKKINTSIMVWLRAPGCLYHAVFAWMCTIDIHKRRNGGETGIILVNSPFPQDSLIWLDIALLVTVGTFFWNGLFFMERVVANYATKSTLAKAAEPKEKPT